MQTEIVSVIICACLFFRDTLYFVYAVCVLVQCLEFQCIDIWLNYFQLSPVNNIEGGYRNSQRPSIRPSVCLSVRLSVRPSQMKVLSQPQFFTNPPKFIQHVYTNEKFYNMQFHKKVAKIVAMATVFLFKLSCISAYVWSLHESMKVTSSQTFTIS